MAEPKENVLMEKIVSLCKRRGFIYQSSEIYGGINGFWDYGPLGAELKRNVKELWWREMTRLRDDVVGLEATIIMHPQIWKASGHVETFADLMRECPHTKKRVRADQVDCQKGTAHYFLGAVGDPPFGEPSQYVHDDPETDYERRVVDDYMAKEKPNSLDNLSLSKLMVLAEERFRQKYPNETSERLAGFAQHVVDRVKNNLCRRPVGILVPHGKPPESARKLATEFYERTLKIRNAHPIGWRIEKVEDSVDFHPETGFELSPARPFNLMFKTSVGPVDVPPIDFDRLDELLADREKLTDWFSAFSESQKNTAYLRPETAQAIFAQFKNVLETSRQRIPFGIAQVGKAFRNEVTPRNYTFRSREFEQMELEFFIRPDEAIEALHGSVARVPAQGHPGEPQPSWGWQAWHRYWVEERVRFYEDIGLSRATLGFHVQEANELAHYARATVDILYKFPFSKEENGVVKGDELEGIAARGDFDLSQHEKFSGKPLTVFDEEVRGAWTKFPEEKKSELRDDFIEAKTRVNIEKKQMTLDDAATAARKEAEVFFDRLAKGQYLPHVIEPSAGVDRLILALICNAFSEMHDPDEKGKSESRVVMRFHPRVAPIKVGVMPLLKNKPDLVKKACEIRDMLRPHMNVFFDDAGSIGRRYARMDEAGTPFCITVDFETMEGMKEGALTGEKDTVTIRYRGNTDEENGKQERIAIAQLLPWLQERAR